MTVGESLKRFRKAFKLTQKEVADVLGVKQQSYVYETKDVTPSVNVIIKLADHYDVSTDYLLGRTDNPRPLTTSNEPQELTADNELTEENQSLKADVQTLKEDIAILKAAVAKMAS
ncbi:MAG: helix-turn-helix transcriptional regulator [Selenomonadaceae bacterium]|nr:helix-turn-helix transcriptional regulator [Selenomonadaceae bacterium]